MPEATTSVIVTVGDDMLANVNEVADRLAAKGLRISRVMPITGVIAGSCSPAEVSALREVRGVVSVEEEVVARVPPPGERLQ